MKTLLLLRHAKSAWSDPRLDDHDRPLSGRGERAAKAMAGLGVNALAEHGLIQAAKADLTKRTARTPYVSPLPDDVSPPLDMSLT